MTIFPKYAGLFRQVIAGSAVSLGVLASATIFGWLTPILPELMGPDSEVPMTSEQASWVVTVPEFGNLLSPVPAGIIADRFGRKIVILSSAPIFIIGWVIILYFKTLLALNVARIIQGLAVGIVYTAIPMYLGEIASPKYRGKITSLFYCFWWFGYLFEFFLGPLMSYTYFTYLSAFTNVIFFVAFMWQPESPYYYLLRNDVAGARQSLSWLLCSSEEETNRELARMQQCVEEDKQKKVRWNELVATSTDRKALMILFLIGFLRNVCGLIPLSQFSTQTLKSSGDYFIISPDGVTTTMGVMMFLGSVFSFFTLDKFGRRTLLLLSCSVSGVSMLAAGTFYFLKAESSVDVSSYGWVPPVSLILLSAVSVVGIFPVNVAYVSELFTSRTRGTAAGVFATYTTFICIFVMKFYLTISDNFGVYLNFYIFAVVNIVGVFLSWSVFPETKGKTFEQIRLELEKR